MDVAHRPAAIAGNYQFELIDDLAADSVKNGLIIAFFL